MMSPTTEVYASKTAYIAGETFTLAECAFSPLLTYMVHRSFKVGKA